MNVVAPRRTVAQSLTGIWRYRELLLNLVRKELKVRYKNSSLGFIWSMLNPAMYLVVFYVVFQLVLKAGIPYFAVFLLSGLLAWNLFSASLAGAAGSITGNAPLVNKVYFPREILPLASVGANCVHFALQGVVLIGALVAFRFDVDWGYVWLVVPAVLALLLITSAAAIFLAAANVYARDTQHFLELALLAWFWMTPIVYPVPFVLTRVSPLLAKLYFLNPMNAVVLAFQRAIYGPVDAHAIASGQSPVLPDAGLGWYLTKLGSVGAASLVLLVVAWAIFRRLESRVAEEL